jgi:hypothetical protein
MLISIGASLPACVSVSLDKSKVRRSENYRVNAPASPFIRHDSTHVDHAWKNQKSGTIISVISECSESIDPALSLLRDEVLRPLTGLMIESDKEVSFQNRGAIRSFARGRVDGVDSAVDLLVFKKNGCSYVLSLVGTPADVRDDQPKFDAFLKGFEAP